MSELRARLNKLERFSLHVADEVLVDLRLRLERVRWPDEIPDGGWQYGANLSFMQGIVRYWLNDFDWRAAEARLNSFEQYRWETGGTNLHFIVAEGEGRSPTPLLLPHGWPGSVAEHLDLIPRLTRPSEFGGDPADAFTVIAPSLPGHGLSFVPSQARQGIVEIADTLAMLMRDALGFDRFAIHGHDWGAFIAARMGYAYPENVTGIHVALLAVPRDTALLDESDPEEAAFADQLRAWIREETGYSLVMGTKPQTLAYGLTDSPVGLAAWVLEKFHSWSDCEGDLLRHLSIDTLLTNIMLYWATGAINSTFWPYYARHHEPWIIPPGEKVRVPTGYAEHPKEILRPPRAVADRHFADIRRWTRMRSGGHFPGLEAPEPLAREVCGFFGDLKKARVGTRNLDTQTSLHHNGGDWQ